jgi:hypothetical protein
MSRLVERVSSTGADGHKQRERQLLVLSCRLVEPPLRVDKDFSYSLSRTLGE